MCDFHIKTSAENDLFIRACFQESVDRTPVWMMRQAGRYLPEYREIRKNYDFLTMYKTPDLAAEVTIQPVDLIGVDAAILFSDILVIPEAMGMDLHFFEGKGPVFPTPIREKWQVDDLKTADPEKKLFFVPEAISLVRGQLNNRVPLIGFSGAPWTLAAYMIEGRGSKNFENAKLWRFTRPGLLHLLLKKITASVELYVEAQIDAGAQAVQLFDTWAGLLDPDGFKEFALPYVQEIFQKVKKAGIPLIYFGKGTGQWFDSLLETGADVIGIDWTTDLGWARKRANGKVALQGNLDPLALLAPPEIIREKVQKILEKFGKGNGHIFNLGHGILPTVPPEHAGALVQAVKEESSRYHNTGE